MALIAGGLGLAWYQMARVDDRLSNLEQGQLSITRTNQAQIDAMKESVQSLSVDIEQQGSLVHRVVGTVVPIKIPEGAERELTRIEDIVADHDTLLSLKDETELLTRELALLVEKLPPWVQTELFPRILPLRWQLDALWLLQHELPENVEELEDLAADLLAQALNRPQRVPERLEELLLIKAEEAIQEASRRDEALRFEQAREGFRENLLRQIEAIESDSKLFERLEDLELKARLASSILATSQDLKIAALASSLDDAERMTTIDSLAFAAHVRMNDVRTEAHRQQQELARSYQIWALEQIRHVPELSGLENDKLAEIESRIDRRLPMGKDRTAALNNAQDDLVRILIEKLAIIDTRLLDEAVSEWHRRVFSSRFASLDEERQLEVVKGFANSIKLSPEEVP